MEVAVLVTSVYAIMTLESIKKAMPDYDPIVIYVGFKCLPVMEYLAGTRHQGYKTLEIDAFDLKGVHGALRRITREPTLVIDSGMLLLKDPSKHLPKLPADHTYSSMVSRLYMYTRRMLNNRSYKAIGVDTKDDLNPSAALHYTHNEFNGTKIGHLDTKFRFGPDPLVENFFGGREWVRHAQEACQACVIDFLPQALNHNSSVVEAYAYPFDIYSYFAEKAKPWIPPGAYREMVRNGKRSGIIAPLRKFNKPPVAIMPPKEVS
jgi:hypothetical protein